MIRRPLWTAALVLAAVSFGPAADRQYTRLFLPLPENHHSEAFAVNSKSEVLIRDLGDLSTCCATRSIAVYLWSEKAGLRPVIEYPDPVSTPRLFLNDDGEVAGTRTVGLEQVVFIWSAKHGMRDLGRFRSGGVTGFSNRGEVVGVLYDGGLLFGFIATEKDGLRRLSNTPTPAFGVNDKGVVVGTIHPPCPVDQTCFNRQAFVWTEKGAIRPVPDPSGSGYVEGMAINDRGDVLAAAYQPDSTWVLFTWSEKQGVEGQLLLPRFGLGDGPKVFNNRGEVVFHADPVNAPTRSYIWSAERGARDLGTLGDSVVVHALNDKGEVVGLSSVQPGGPAHAFLWTASCGITDLDPGVFSAAAYAINEDGVIGGAASVPGRRGAVVWQPVKGRP
jgi:probable HAF family extracellular repeat protein